MNLPPEAKNNYFIGKCLGHGAGGTVNLAYDVKTEENFAVKEVEKGRFSYLLQRDAEADSAKILKEINIMRELSHVS